MKTITIPKSFGYPTTEVVANGKHYMLKSGEEIEVEDFLAEIIENAIALEPKPNPIGYSKIANITVKAGADGTLPNLIEINADENDKPFRIRDFFLMITTKLTDGSTTRRLQIIGKNGEDNKCITGFAPTEFSATLEKKAWARFTTFGQDGNGGGLLMVGRQTIETAHGLYGTSLNYTGTDTSASPTEPAVSLKEGIDKVVVRMSDNDYKYTEFPEGSKLELWGVRI